MYVQNPIRNLPNIICIFLFIGVDPRPCVYKCIAPRSNFPGYEYRIEIRWCAYNIWYANPNCSLLIPILEQGVGKRCPSAGCKDGEGSVIVLFSKWEAGRAQSSSPLKRELNLRGDLWTVAVAFPWNTIQRMCFCLDFTSFISFAAERCERKRGTYFQTLLKRITVVIVFWLNAYKVKVRDSPWGTSGYD